MVTVLESADNCGVRAAVAQNRPAGVPADYSSQPPKSNVRVKGGTPARIVFLTKKNIFLKVSQNRFSDS